MPPKSQDSTILNAIRLARTQPVTFGKGLIRTDDNSVLGYVSDLNNMEIDRNGNARRRKGTVAMNSGKLNDKWYFLESYQIAGVPIFFGLSYKRELWAWIDTWSEVDIKVCDKNTYGRFPHYSANSTDPDFNTWVSFSRGSSFHVLKTDRHITIVNNLNDAIRIYSKGCFALAAYKEDVTQVFMKEDIDIVRENPEIELAMYLSIKDVTNKIIEPAITVRTDNRNPLVEGTVQFASINEEGTAGRFTDLQKVETSSPNFSMFESLSVFEENIKIGKYGESFASDGSSDVEYGVIKKGAGDDYSLVSGTWTPDYSLTGYTKETYNAAIIVEKFIDGNWNITSKAWLVLKNYTTTPKKIDSSINVLFKIKNMFTWFSKKGEPELARYRNMGNRLFALTGVEKYSYGLNFASITGFTHATEPRFSINFDEAKQSAVWYEMDVPEDDEIFGMDGENCEFNYTSGTKEEILRNAFAGTAGACILNGDIDLYYEPSHPDTYRLDEAILLYNSFVLSKNFSVFEHLGFNTWYVSEKSGSILLPDITINSNFDIVVSKFSGKEKMLVNNTNDQAMLFLENGFKWCVKCNDKIMVESQIGILNSAKDNIVYSISYSTSGLPVNVNELPSELLPCYIPVVSLHGSSLFSYIDQDKNREVFYDVQYAFNVDNQLLVIQDGAIWVGDTNTLKLTYDKAIQGAVLCADKFYGGLLIGTTDGLYFYNQGQLTNVIDGQAIIAKGIRSGVNGALVIDEYGRPQYITVQINEGGVYGRLIDISQTVSDIVFDGINMIFVDGVFYVAQDDKVFGLTVYREEGGLLAVWNRVYVWEGQKISLIANHNNRLVVAFETGAVKSEVFEQPWNEDIS